MNAGHAQLRPCVRADGLVIHALPDEVLVYDLERHKAHCLNHTAALVWKLCDGQTCVSEMAGILGREMHTPNPEDFVWLALRKLGKACLLAEQTPTPGAKGKLSRRGDAPAGVGGGGGLAAGDEYCGTNGGRGGVVLKYGVCL